MYIKISHNKEFLIWITTNKCTLFYFRFKLGIKFQFVSIKIHNSKYNKLIL